MSTKSIMYENVFFVRYCTKFQMYLLLDYYYHYYNYLFCFFTLRLWSLKLKVKFSFRRESKNSASSRLHRQTMCQKVHNPGKRGSVRSDNPSGGYALSFTLQYASRSRVFRGPGEIHPREI